MEYPDFTTVTWTRNSEEKKRVIVPRSNPDRHQQKIDQSNDIVPINKIDPKLAKRCVEARLKKNLTRTQLANQLSISEAYVNDFENCGKKPESKVMNKILNFINKILG